MRVSLQTLIDRSVRNMGDVHPTVRQKAIYLIQQAYAEGINVQISSGHRSREHQQRLFEQGRTTSGNIVTNAKAGQSVHNYGLAIDYFLTSEDGEESVWTINSDWKRVAAIAKSMGFSWGGDWSSFKDYPHLELTDGLTWKDLSQGKRPTHLLTSYLEKGNSGAEVKALQERLNELGYDIGDFGADGAFGEDTERALKEFQQDHDLEVDGIYGDNTKEQIDKAHSKTVRIKTGGLGDKALNEVSEYFKAKGWWAQVKFSGKKNPTATTGGLSYKRRIDFEKWLIDRDWWYKVIK
ncbi:peptidoglycan-binding protein [Pontibacillus salipaludis]|uniref:Peptidoglycan L-alanyl-D-glutamate endopeptidase CwlK n=1 Tax=Pontibacillus salipaludis TaxID=1697394 RepID=A0ABQ1PWP5_9BACI|nr:peptidoglycan-binding protein [Pontibacillus salipaludis]GGD05486.1 hypothetical protein GCM10011389_11260 [Pontibacillus salipaludis]